MSNQQDRIMRLFIEEAKERPRYFRKWFSGFKVHDERPRKRPRDVERPIP